MSDLRGCGLSVSSTLSDGDVAQRDGFVPVAAFRKTEARHLACGVDVVEMDQFTRDVSLGGEHFLRRIYTEAELAFCRGRIERLATRFAAKEAIAKALGTGIRGVGWRAMEVVSSADGQPQVVLHGRAGKLAESAGLGTWALSLSHTPVRAIAYVVALADKSAWAGS